MRDNISSGALTETTLLVLLALYKELHGYGVKLFIEEKGLPGWAPTQGHIPSGVPYVGFLVEESGRQRMDC